MKYISLSILLIILPIIFLIFELIPISLATEIIGPDTVIANNNITFFVNNSTYDNYSLSTPSLFLTKIFNQTIILNLNETGEYTLCVEDVCKDFEVIQYCSSSIKIDTDKNIYNTSEKISFKHNITASSKWYIEYWIENSYGEIVKNKINTTSLAKKSFSLNGRKEEALFLKAKLYSCDIKEDIKVIGILQQKKETDENIEEVENLRNNIQNTSITVLDNSSKTDDIVYFNVRIIKGNERKYALKSYIENDGEKVSEETKLWMKKPGDLEILIPIVMKKCVDKGTLIIDGLGIIKKEEIFFDGECKNESIENGKDEEKNTKDETIFQPIKSVYTRNKIIEKNINLYFTVEGEGDYDIIVDSITEQINLTKEINGRETLKFPVNLINGKNVIGIKVSSKNNTQERLFIVESNQEIKDDTNYDREDDNSNRDNDNINNETEDTKGINLSYKTKDEKVNSHNYYILIAILGLVIILILYEKGVNYLKAV